MDVPGALQQTLAGQLPLSQLYLILNEAFKRGDLHRWNAEVDMEHLATLLHELETVYYNPHMQDSPRVVRAMMRAIAKCQKS